MISPADLKNAFSKVLNLNGGRYMDQVYSRLYGKSEADIIDKLKFTDSILFVRYLLHVDNGEWKIFDIEFKTESSAPFPKEWRHIYP